MLDTSGLALQYVQHVGGIVASTDGLAVGGLVLRLRMLVAAGAVGEHVLRLRMVVAVRGMYCEY